MWAQILTQDYNSASCEHLMVFIFEEKKREGSADLSVLTRTRLVKGNPEVWKEEQRAGMAQEGTHFSLETVWLPGGSSHHMPSQQKVSHPRPETEGAAVHPMLYSQLEEKSLRFTQSTFSQAHCRGAWDKLVLSSWSVLKANSAHHHYSPAQGYEEIWAKAAVDHAQPVLNDSNGVYITPVILNVHMFPVNTQGLCHWKSWSLGSISMAGSTSLVPAKHPEFLVS